MARLRLAAVADTELRGKGEIPRKRQEVNIPQWEKLLTASQSSIIIWYARSRVARDLDQTISPSSNLSGLSLSHQSLRFSPTQRQGRRLETSRERGMN